MTDLEKELTRQIHELSKELIALRERIAVLEYKASIISTAPNTVPKHPWEPPFTVTCATSGYTGMAGRD